MSTPSVEEKGTSYIFTWAEEKINIKVSRIVEHRDKVTAEVVVSTLLSPESPHLLHSNLNITSSQAKNSIVKDLDGKYKIKTDWKAIIEQLCVIALQRFRQGESAVELWGFDTEVKPPEYLLYPLMVKNYPNVIFGDPGSFKSAFAKICTALITLPVKENGLGLTPRSTPSKCLYLDWETDRETVNWTLMRVTKGMDLPPFAISYRRCTFPLSNGAEQIGQMIADIGVDTVIIDSLGLAAGRDLLKTESPIEFFSALRLFKVTSLILAHNAKDERQNRSIYGNQYFTAQSRNIWEIRTVKEAGDEEMDIVLLHKKAPPFSKMQKPFGYHIDFTPETITIRKEDATDHFIAIMSTRIRILDLLKDGAMSIKDIANKLEITENNTRVSISRLERDGKIIKVGKEYGLLSYEE